MTHGLGGPVGGTDTMRGAAFQHAAAVLACIDAVDDTRVAAITVEGTQDAVDLAALDADGRTVWARQMKTRAEPYTWTKAGLVAVLTQWAATPGSDQTPYEFWTDGPLTTWGVNLTKLLAAGDYGAAAVASGVEADVLKGVTVLSRVESSHVLLERAELHLARAGEPLVTASEARVRVNELLRIVTLASGEQTESLRTLTVEQLSLQLGLLPARVRAGGRGSGVFGPSRVVRDELLADVLAGLRFGDTSRGRVALWGFSGFGKSTLAEQAYDASTGVGRSAVLVRVEPNDDAHAVLGRVLTQLLRRPPHDYALSALAVELANASATLDLLVCDNVGSEEVAATLAASLAPRTGLLITKRSHHLPQEFLGIEVGPLDEAAVIQVLEAEIPGTDVDELARQVRGWPLLLDLIRTSLGRHLEVGGDGQAIVDDHARRLRAAQVPDLGGGGLAPIAAVELALEPLPAELRLPALSLGVLRTSRALPLSVHAALWGLDDQAARRTIVSLASVALVRLEGLGQVAVHDALLATFDSMLTGDVRESLHGRLAEHDWTATEERYFVEHVPAHLAASGDASAALTRLADQAWCDQVREVLGTPLHLSRQAQDVFEMLCERPDPSLSMVCAAWLLRRLYGTQFVLDHRVAAIFSAIHGLGLTETLLRSAGSSGDVALAHAELAATLHKAGRLADAQRNAKAALRAARSDSEHDLPDTLLVTVQTLGRAASEWTRTSLEAIEYVISNQRDASSAYLSRAVAAATLLPLDPDVARSVAQPLLDRVTSTLVSGASLHEALGPSAAEIIRNVLPTMAFYDLDMAMLLREQAAEEDLDDGHGDAQLDVGTMLSGTSLTDEALARIASDDVLSLQDVIAFLARLRRYEDAARLIRQVGGRLRRARMLTALGSIMHSNGESGPDVERAFSEAAGLVRGVADGALVAFLPSMAADVAGFDDAWAKKLAKQALDYSHVVQRADERVAVEGSALAVLAESAPDQLPAEIDDLLRRAGASRIPRDPMSVLEATETFEMNVYASTLTELAEVPRDEFLASRGGATPDLSLYWSRWSQRLEEQRSPKDANLALSDPGFTTWAAQTSGAVAWAVALLLDADDPVDWTELGRAMAPDFRDGYLVDVALLRLHAGQISARQARSKIRRLAREDERARGLGGADALSHQESDIVRALRSLLPAYLVARPDTAIIRSTGRVHLRIQRLPLAARLALENRISIAELREAIAGYESRGGIPAFLADAVTLASTATVDDVDALVAALDGDEMHTRPALLAGLEVVAQSDPSSVAHWLMRQATTESPFGMEMSMDDWSSLALRVLHSDSLPAHVGEELRVDGRNRLASLDFGVETRAGMDLAVEVAPNGDPEAQRFVEDACAPFLRGPVVCRLASKRKTSTTEWLAMYKAGLAATGAAGGESVASVAFSAGEAMADVAENLGIALARMDGFDAWPGQYVGAANGAAGMAPLLVRSGPLDTLAVLDVLRNATRVASTLLLSGEHPD